MGYTPETMIIDCPACHSRFLIPDTALGVVGRTVRCGRCRNQWFQSPESLPEHFGAPLTDFRPTSADDMVSAQDQARTAAQPKVPNDEFGSEDAPPAAATASAQAPAENATANTDTVVDHLERRAQSAAARAEASKNDGIHDFLPPPDPSTPYDHRLVPALRARQPASLWLKASTLSMTALAACLLVIAYAPLLATHAAWSLPVLRALGAAPADGLMLTDVAFESRAETEQYRRFIIGCNVRNTSDTVRALPDLRLQLYNRAGERIIEERKLLAPIPMIAPGDDIPCDIPAPAMRPGTAQTIVLDLGSPLDLWKRAPLY